MSSLGDLVILFTRYPHPGKCKTRLIPTLGGEGAAKVHRQLVAHNIATLSTFSTLHANTTYHIYYDGASVQDMEQWLGKQILMKQHGNNIGERMANALIMELQTAENCLLVGSDCPDISPELLKEAFQALQQNDLILGPAYDGGYYLIGVNKSCKIEAIRQLFRGIHWGSDRVLQETRLRANELHFRVHLLQKLHDIDTPDDLKYFHHYPHPE
jgi:hypothetical protein